MACEKSVVAGAKPMWVPQSKSLKLLYFISLKCFYSKMLNKKVKTIISYVYGMWLITKIL